MPEIFGPYLPPDYFPAAYFAGSGEATGSTVDAGAVLLGNTTVTASLAVEAPEIEIEAGGGKPQWRDMRFLPRQAPAYAPAAAAMQGRGAVMTKAAGAASARVLARGGASAAGRAVGAAAVGGLVRGSAAVAAAAQTRRNYAADDNAFWLMAA